jgi:transcriptional regulator with XRE-family HTH domain
MITLFQLRKNTEARRGQTISARSVAQSLGISPQSYGYYERGRQVPSALIVRKLAAFYGVSVEEVIEIIENTVKQYQTQEEDEDEETPKARAIGA